MQDTQPDLQEQTQEENQRNNRFQTILKNLRIIFRSSQAHSRWVEKELGLSAGQLWMMWELFNEPGLTVSGLAKKMTIHQSTCSNLLDKIQKKELIYRDRNSDDQRLVRLYLTDKGTQLLARAPRPAQGILTDTLLSLQDEALDELESGLDSFVSALKIKNREAGMVPISEE